MTSPSGRHPAAESDAPYGTGAPRRRWLLVLWIVLFAAWLGFLVILAARDVLR
jgi:hypothetical protein